MMRAFWVIVGGEEPHPTTLSFPFPNFISLSPNFLTLIPLLSLFSDCPGEGECKECLWSQVSLKQSCANWVFSLGRSELQSLCLGWPPILFPAGNDCMSNDCTLEP